MPFAIQKTDQEVWLTRNGAWTADFSKAQLYVSWDGAAQRCDGLPCGSSFIRDAYLTVTPDARVARPVPWKTVYLVEPGSERAGPTGIYAMRKPETFECYGNFCATLVAAQAKLSEEAKRRALAIAKLRTELSREEKLLAKFSDAMTAINAGQVPAQPEEK